MTEITDEVFSSIGYCMIVNSIYNIVDQIFIQRSADGSLYISIIFIGTVLKVNALAIGVVLAAREFVSLNKKIKNEETASG